MYISMHSEGGNYHFTAVKGLRRNHRAIMSSEELKSMQNPKFKSKRTRKYFAIKKVKKELLSNEGI